MVRYFTHFVALVRMGEFGEEMRDWGIIGKGKVAFFKGEKRCGSKRKNPVLQRLKMDKGSHVDVTGYIQGEPQLGTY